MKNSPNSDQPVAWNVVEQTSRVFPVQRFLRVVLEFKDGRKRTLRATFAQRSHVDKYMRRFYPELVGKEKDVKERGHGVRSCHGTRTMAVFLQDDCDALVTQHWIVQLQGSRRRHLVGIGDLGEPADITLCGKDATDRCGTAVRSSNGAAITHDVCKKCWGKIELALVRLSGTLTPDQVKAAAGLIGVRFRPKAGNH